MMKATSTPASESDTNSVCSVTVSQLGVEYQHETDGLEFHNHNIDIYQDDELKQTQNTWKICKENIPKSEIIYFCEMFLIATVIFLSILNLSLGTGPQSLWIMLASSTLGILAPSPTRQKTQKDPLYEQLPLSTPMPPKTHSADSHKSQGVIK